MLKFFQHLCSSVTIDPEIVDPEFNSGAWFRMTITDYGEKSYHEKSYHWQIVPC